MGFISAASVQNRMIIYGDNFSVTTDQTNYNNEEPTEEPNTPASGSSNNNGPHFGWGGYITSTRDVVTILDDMADDGYNAIRYWARPYWHYGSSYHSLDYAVLDLLVNEAQKRGITVYIDCEHNYPPEAFITSSNRDTWINDVIKVGLRYNNYNNVVLEPINEYHRKRSSITLQLGNGQNKTSRNPPTPTMELLVEPTKRSTKRPRQQLRNRQTPIRRWIGRIRSVNPLLLEYAVEESGIAIQCIDISTIKDSHFIFKAFLI